MKLFLDTEFTDLIPGNKLISIALVDENGEYFYAELTDTYELSECSAFVKESVLPYLRGGTNRMTSYECSLNLGTWIEDRDKACILALDNPGWDLPHIKDLLADCWPQNLHKNQYFPVCIPSDVQAQIVSDFNYKIHNALDDALVMMRYYVSDKYI